MKRKRTLRELRAEEQQRLEQLSRSRTAAHRLVERAQALLAVAAGASGYQVARRLGHKPDTVYRWLDRFEAEGLDGLTDQVRSGRPARYDEQQRGQCIATARTAPAQLGLPFGHWTLDRLVTYLQTEQALPISRAQLARVLEAEGLRWYQEQSYFTERPDPQYAEKRGR